MRGVEFGVGGSASAEVQARFDEALADARGALGGAPERLWLVFGSPDSSFEEVMERAAAVADPGVPVIGCTTAGEISSNLGLQHGSLTLAILAGDGISAYAALAENIKSQPADAVSRLSGGHGDARRVAAERGLCESTSIILIDGLAATGEELVDALRRDLGGLSTVVGGAAGDEARLEKTWVALGGTVASDAAVVAHVFSEKPWSIGVDHGLKPATELYRVTRAEGPILYELEGRPVWDVYSEYARTKGIELTKENAASFLINNELGVYVFGSFKKARAPLVVTDDGGFLCAAAIPTGASVAILDGEADSMVTAARGAASQARERIKGGVAGVLLFDCVCRGTILGSAFDQELEAVASAFPSEPVAGFLTYGEIARYSGQLDGWHNTTAVVVAIPE